MRENWVRTELQSMIFYSVLAVDVDESVVACTYVCVVSWWHMIDVPVVAKDSMLHCSFISSSSSSSIYIIISCSSRGSSSTLAKGLLLH